MCQNPLPTSEPPTEATQIGKILREARLIDTAPDASFDRFISLASRTLKVPTAVISLLDTSRQWFKSRVGFETSQTHCDIAFCSHTILETSPDVLVVPDALEDDRFKENPLVLGPPHIRFYAGAAMRVQGKKVGTLCVIDTKPRYDFGERELQTLIDISGMAASLIEARRGNVLQLEQELARITMSVLYSIKQPLDALTQASRSMNEKWRDLPVDLQVHSHQPYLSLKQEHGEKALEDAVSLQDKASILQAFLDLSLKAAGRLLDTDHSGTKLPRLVACDLESLVDKAEVMVSRCKLLCESDSQVMASSTAWHSKISLSPTSSSELPSPCNRSFSRLFSHPDLFSLIMVSMIVSLDSQANEVNAVNIEKEEMFQGLTFSESHLSGIIDTNVGSGVVRRKHLQLPESSSWCGGNLKMVVVAATAVHIDSLNIQSLNYLIENVGGSFRHEVDNELNQSVFTVSIPYMQLETL